MASAGASITVGIDTHADAHVGVALDQLGQLQGEVFVPNDDNSGYQNLLKWALSFGKPISASGSRPREATEPDCRAFWDLGECAWWRSSASAANTVGGAPSTTPPTPRLPPEWFFLAKQRASRKPPTDEWRCSARSEGGSPLGGESQDAGGQPAPRVGHDRSRKAQSGPS